MVDALIIHQASQVQNVSAGGQQTQSATEAGTPSPSPPQGTLISGTIAGKDASGNYLLKSEAGTFAIQSKVPLTYNSDVTIRVGASTAAGTTTRIVSVNGETFAEFSTPEPSESDSVSSSVPVQNPTTNSGAPQASLPGVVTSAPPAAADGSGQTLTEGSNVVIKLPQDALETQQTQNATPQTSPNIAASATVATQPQQLAQNPQAAAVPQPANAPAPLPATAAAITTVPAAATTELAASETVAATTQEGTTQNQPQNQQPQAQTQTPQAPASPLYSAYTKSAAAPAPQAAPAQTSSATPAPTLPAQVVSTDENGNLNLQTALGLVSVKTPALPALATLPVGTPVTLELPAALPQAGQSAEPASLSELASSWQSLKDIASQPSVASTGLLARLPQLGPDFASSTMSFISSLLQGDARKLLGDDTIDALHKNGRGDLVEKFSSEMAELGSSFSAPVEQKSGGWQTLFLPFVYQEALQQARIYVKRETPKKEKSAKGGADTRFVLEVDLSEIGPLQMDGLVRKKEQATAFDLVIRSQKPFLSEDQVQISAIYADAAALTGFKGSLSFQVTRDFPVKPLEEAIGGAEHSFTV